MRLGCIGGGLDSGGSALISCYRRRFIIALPFVTVTAAMQCARGCGRRWLGRPRSPPFSAARRSSARYRHWPFRCCSSPTRRPGSGTASASSPATFAGSGRRRSSSSLTTTKMAEARPLVRGSCGGGSRPCCGHFARKRRSTKPCRRRAAVVLFRSSAKGPGKNGALVVPGLLQTAEYADHLERTGKCVPFVRGKTAAGAPRAGRSGWRCAPGSAVDSDLLGDVGGGGEASAVRAERAGPGEYCQAGPRITDLNGQGAVLQQQRDRHGRAAVRPGVGAELGGDEADVAGQTAQAPVVHRRPGPGRGARDGDAGRGSRFYRAAPLGQVRGSRRAVGAHAGSFLR